MIYLESIDVIDTTEGRILGNVRSSTTNFCSVIRVCDCIINGTATRFGDRYNTVAATLANIPLSLKSEI